MAKWRRKVSMYIGGPDDSSSFIRATFPRQTQPRPHNLLVFATPYQRCEVACCWGRTYMIRVRRGGPPQGILGAKSNHTARADRRMVHGNQDRGRACTREDWTDVACSGLGLPRTRTANLSTPMVALRVARLHHRGKACADDSGRRAWRGNGTELVVTDADACGMAL
ncbi:hypothetical protein K438DRAFT_1780197 [Mycena galopus ATCC 62051]|nr:hypothetical protein K438DRAFT_1780197 [Mycena galopus ATCC 62051]